MESRDTPTKFVLDVVALLEALGDREYIPVFLEMLEYDGPDVARLRPAFRRNRVPAKLNERDILQTAETLCANKE